MNYSSLNETYIDEDLDGRRVPMGQSWYHDGQCYQVKKS